MTTIFLISNEDCEIHDIKYDDNDAAEKYGFGLTKEESDYSPLLKDMLQEHNPTENAIICIPHCTRIELKYIVDYMKRHWNDNPEYDEIIKKPLNEKFEDIKTIPKWDRNFIASYINENNNSDKNLQRLSNLANFFNIQALLYLIGAKIAEQYYYSNEDFIQKMYTFFYDFDKSKRDKKMIKNDLKKLYVKDVIKKYIMDYIIYDPIITFKFNHQANLPTNEYNFVELIEMRASEKLVELNNKMDEIVQERINDAYGPVENDVFNLSSSARNNLRNFRISTLIKDELIYRTSSSPNNYVFEISSVWSGP